MADFTQILLPYQRQWLADQSAVKLCEKARRIGITWAEALDAVLHAAPAGGANTWYAGYNREMAKEFIDDCVWWIERLGEQSDAHEEIILRDDESDIRGYEIRFASRAKIVALSSSPRNLRGKQGRAVIDEAAFHRDLRATIKAALAFRLWGGSVRVISTHFGTDSLFNEMLIDARAGKRPYSVHRYTFQEAVAQGLYKKISEATNRKWTRKAEREWVAEVYSDYGDDAGEELDVIPSSHTDAFLSASLIEARMGAGAVARWSLDDAFAQMAESERASRGALWCNDHLACHLDKLKGLRTGVGVDFARDGDLTVIWVAQRQPDNRIATPLVAELRNVPFRQQDQVLFFVADWLASRGPLTLAMDARGSGAYLCESAAGRYGARVTPVTMAREWYADAMPGMKGLFEDAQIELPRDPDILADLRSLRMQDGIAKPPEKRTRSASDRGKRHGDAAIAAALATWSLKQSAIEYAYMRPRRRPRGILSAPPAGPPVHDDDLPRRGVRGIGRFF